MRQSRVQAVLGPTNTGKTHYAIERMLAYNSGVIGLPLRLLAREVYDKIVAIKGPSVVALLTGEERIVPGRTQWWVCTTEAMPEGIGADFVAIDEIQLAADPERGHVFTDRLLHMRGRYETLFLGAETMRAAIRTLVPEADHHPRERLSQLRYSGPKKLSRLPPRTAVVGFSVSSVYAMAELLRRQKGGAAVVMGALSPRTRNAQVAMYQNGDVDYLVATDAIGMGLNLDINHVAFSSLAKFDGTRIRALRADELGQIAGRAGRNRSDGSFGVTGEAGPLDDGVIDAIETSRFQPVGRLFWRSRDLDFGTPARLIKSLERRTDNPLLSRVRDTDDLKALKDLSTRPDILDRATTPSAIKQLWDVCRIPDFRDISASEHAALLAEIYLHLAEDGVIPDTMLASRLNRIDRTEGTIDALAKRLAYVRTWTYVTERPGWIDDATHWRERARQVEDRLSDALHSALRQRFVDQRSSVLLKRLKQKERIVAEVSETGEVSVEGTFIGRLDGFRFHADKTADSTEARTLRAAAFAALAPHYQLSADRLYNAPDTALELTDQGGLLWGKAVIGKVVRGDSPLAPRVSAFVDEEAGTQIAERVTRRLQHFVDRRIAAQFEPLLAMSQDDALPPAAKGFAFQMVEHFGVIARSDVADTVKALDQTARSALRKHGVRFGQFTIFMPLLLKPAPTRLRLLLWALNEGMQDLPEAPPPGVVTLENPGTLAANQALMSGYREAGTRMIRIDMLERLADMIRTQDTRGGFEANTDMLSITGLSLEKFAELMQGLGYRATKGERPKVKAKPATPAAAEIAAAPTGAETATEAEADPDAVPSQDDLADLATLDGAAPDASEAAATAVAADALQETHDSAAQAAEAEDASRAAEADTPAVMEVFYTFAWAPKRPPRGEGQPNQGRRRDKDAKPNRGGKGKPGQGKADRPHAKGKKADRGPDKPRGKPEKKIDPDNPFAAALAGLALKK